MAPLQDDHDEVVERFQPTSGRVTGWMTVVLAASWWSREWPTPTRASRSG